MNILRTQLNIGIYDNDYLDNHVKVKDHFISLESKEFLHTEIVISILN